jgi:hypothetical protein
MHMTLYREATATIKLIVFFSLTTFLQQVNAQQTGRMDTDRPDQTESVSITKKDYLQAEIGFNKEKYGTGFTWVHPTALWKLGLNSRFELRLITEANTLKSGPTKISGLVPTQIGGKIALWKEKGIIPQTSLIFHTGIPALGSTIFKTPFLSPNFRFTLQHTFTDRIALGYNLGAEWDGNGGSPDWIYTLAPGINLGERWYAYAEIFGSIRSLEKPLHGIDGGIAYYFNENCKIDFSGGKGLNEESVVYYVAVGFSFRIKVLNR